MIPEFRIPGVTLAKSKDECGTVASVEYCKDCGRAEARFYHCNNWDCATCYYYTAVRAAHRVEERLLGVQKAYSVYGKFPGKIVQVVFSVPESEYEDFDLDKEWKRCYEYADMVGVRGGSAIFHPFRVKSEFRKSLFDAVKSLGLKGGLWSGIHSNVLNLGSWKDYVYFAPHFHVLGYYPKIVMKSNVFHELTGWVYKAVHIGKERNVFTTSRYLLTHTAVPEGHKQAVHYFGIASNSKTTVRNIKVKEFKKCPSCGSDAYYLLKGYSSRSFGLLLSGERKPGEDEFFVHVRLVRTIKEYTVKLKLPTLARFNGVTA